MQTLNQEIGQPAAEALPMPEDLITLAEAAKQLPCSKPGRKVHVSTLVRWILGGKLPGWRIAGRLFVSQADIRHLGRPIPARGKTPASRAPTSLDRAREAHTRQRLKAHGIEVP